MRNQRAAGAPPPRPTSLAEWREAADGSAGSVTSTHAEGDHVVVVHRWRKPGAPRVVLVHGIGMGQQYFGLLRAELADAFDVVALDLPGFGESPEPAESLPMAALADLVAAALEASRSATRWARRWWPSPRCGTRRSSSGSCSSPRP